jgi:3-hydroxyacyl-[acyl-carrier-protein] dehydratase
MNEDSALSAIPHRSPFLFIDEVVEAAEKRIVARKYVDPTEEFFRGHFPGHPVMPGVLICECCFQAGALLMARRTGSPLGGAGLPVLTRIQDARFKRIVRPGETLAIEVVLDDVVDQAYYMTGRVHVEGRSVLRVGFACMSAPWP